MRLKSGRQDSSYVLLRIASGRGGGTQLPDSGKFHLLTPTFFPNIDCGIISPNSRIFLGNSGRVPGTWHLPPLILKILYEYILKMQVE